MSQACSELHNLVNSLPRHSFPYNPLLIPENGIYFLFEKGETGHGGDRVVRVGTHTGDNQLRARLGQHFLCENKDRSIFRKNIGRAILYRRNDDYLADWEIDRTTRSAREKYGLGDIEKKKMVEKQISQYLRSSLSFAVLQVDHTATRLLYEARIISTISQCDTCHPSPGWLGHYSPKEKIGNSGLWLVNELYKEPLNQEDLQSILKLTKL